jgi:uncharacterized protein
MRWDKNNMENEEKKCECNCGPNCKCNSKKKAKIALMFLSVIILGAIVIVSIIRDRIVNQNQYQISVVGQGRVSYIPDTANITLGVQIDKLFRAEDTINQLNKKANTIIDAIVKLGIAKEDIKTQNYNLYSNYDLVGNVSRVNGYSANESIVIKVKDITNNQDLISKVISEATKAGANQINGVVFENSNIENIKQEARIKAIASAREKSKDIEKALGIRLCKIVGMWENYISPMPEAVYSDYAKGGIGGGASSIAPTVPAGTYEVLVEENISYKIK